ncbi:hypothetical protein, partial [Chromobacterium piscinae]|uniref:hypothetical protein n=1 Tax=Chromobacterium piscinae TaxID=686831 RepID=UPI00325FFAFB
MQFGPQRGLLVFAIELDHRDQVLGALGFVVDAGSGDGVAACQQRMGGQRVFYFVGKIVAAADDDDFLLPAEHEQLAVG